MNLLVVNYEYPPIGGGAATATKSLTQCLARAGHAAVVLTSAMRGAAGETDEDGVRVIRLEVGRREAHRSTMTELARFVVSGRRRVRRVAAEHRVEAAIVVFSIPSGVVVLRLPRALPYVVSLQGADVPGFLPELDLMHRLVRPVRRRVLRGARAVIANSRSLAELSERADPVRVGVMPNGVDSEFFSPPAVPRGRAADGPFRLLAVGRMHAQKNFSLLLRGLAALRPPHRDRVRLELVGDGPDLEATKDEARRLGVDGAVAFRGWLTREALRDAYRAADCFAISSVREGMPNVAFEAAACGLPILASRAPGHEDLVVPGATGAQFSLDGTGEFVAELLRLADDPVLCRRMGEAARRRVVEQFTWDAVARACVAPLSSAVAAVAAGAVAKAL